MFRKTTCSLCGGKMKNGQCTICGYKDEKGTAAGKQNKSEKKKKSFSWRNIGNYVNPVLLIEGVVFLIIFLVFSLVNP